MIYTFLMWIIDCKWFENYLQNIILIETDGDFVYSRDLLKLLQKSEIHILHIISKLLQSEIIQAIHPKHAHAHN